MNTPDDLDTILKRLLATAAAGAQPSPLPAEEDAYLEELLRAVRAGQRAIVIVQHNDERLAFMFTNTTRPEAITMLAKVVDATAQQLANGDDI